MGLFKQDSKDIFFILKKTPVFYIYNIPVGLVIYDVGTMGIIS